MSSLFADELFRPGVPESEKIELIYRQGPKLLPEDLETTVTRLREDCRYARLLGALVDASKNEKLATEELFSGNAVSPKIVTSCKWLYTTENKGFISEDFVRKTLPLVSSSCQKQIVHKISKWITNTDLADKLWAILRSRSVELSLMLVGACSNDLIVRVLYETPGQTLSTTQWLDILKKRFDSGLELVRRISKIMTLKDEVYQYILKRNFKEGCEFMKSISKHCRLGRHFTRKLLQCVSRNDLDLSFLLSWVSSLKQSVLAQYATPEVYLKCFLEKFSRKNDGQKPKAMLSWLNHLRDDEKLRILETWYRTETKTALVNATEPVPTSFLFLLDEKTLQQVVSRRMTLIRQSKEFVEADFLLWQSLLPDDEESFAKQKERLKGESSENVRRRIYLNMLDSVIILRRPQYLERRLRFLVKRTRNDYDSQFSLMERLHVTLREEHRFEFNEEIWPHIKEMIDLHLLFRDAYIRSVYVDVLLLGLKKVDFDQKSLFSSIVEKLNEIMVRGTYIGCFKFLSSEKRQYIWNVLLAYREALEETKEVLNGGVCPKHLRHFYLALAEAADATRSLIGAYPKTMKVLKLIVSPEMDRKNFPYFDTCQLVQIYELLQPLLEIGEPLRKCIAELIEEKQVRLRNTEVFKTFRKSKVMTEEVRTLYLERRKKSAFLRLCGRALLHAEPEQQSKWHVMLKEDTENNLRSSSTSHSFDLLAMISEPQQLTAAVASLYPTEATLNLSKGESENVDVLTRIDLVKSLRHFNNTDLALEMISHFMKGDYLQHATRSFNYHLNRLPSAKVVSLLRDRILKKESAVSARKMFLQGFFGKIHMFDEEVIIDIVRQLSVKEEHDNIKNETLIACFTMVKNFGEEKGWPILKTCLDSIHFEDRTCFTETLVSDPSIDRYIPTHFEYLMGRLFEFAWSGKFGDEYTQKLLQRVADNVHMLSFDFLVDMLDRIKCRDWRDYTPEATLAQNILHHCLPGHAEALKAHFLTFGDTEFSDLMNSSRFTQAITKTFLANTFDNAVVVVDFLTSVFETRSCGDSRELRLLELTRGILPLVLEKRKKRLLNESISDVTLRALRVTVKIVEKCGDPFYPELLLEDLKRVFFGIFTTLKRSDLAERLLDVYHCGLNRSEKIVLLSLLNHSQLEEDKIEELKDLFLEDEDLGVRVAFRRFCLDKSL